MTRPCFSALPTLVLRALLATPYALLSVLVIISRFGWVFLLIIVILVEVSSNCHTQRGHGLVHTRSRREVLLHTWQAKAMLMAVSSLSPVSTHTEMPALDISAMAEGTPICECG